MIMPIEKKRFERVEQKKPKFSMDLMIFGNINEINKMIDQSAFDVESGNLNSLFEWKAGLKCLSMNIESFIENDSMLKTIEKTFNILDTLIDPYTQTLPSELTNLKKTILLLRNLNSILYEARNNYFMKIIKIMSTTEKIWRYALGSLPQDKLDDIVENKLGGEDDEGENKVSE